EGRPGGGAGAGARERAPLGGGRRARAPGAAPSVRPVVGGRRLVTAPLAPVPLAELARGGLVVGARGALVRLTGRTGIAVAVAAIALAAVAGVLHRDAAAAQAVDRSLVAIFDLVIPLATFALVSAAIGR